jgi:peptide/nickel transport system permease protein
MTAARRFALCASLLLLGAFGFLAVFADLIASSAPVAFEQDGRVHVLPAITAPERVAHRDRAQIEATAAWALWPLVVAEPAQPAQRTAPSNEPAASSQEPAMLSLLSDRGKLAFWLQGCRFALFTVATVVSIALALGLLLGGFAALGPDPLDAVLARAVELGGILPTVIVVALVRVMEPVPVLAGFIGVLALLRGLEIARIVRTVTLQLSGADFVLAARALGASETRIFIVHILPHAAGAATVSAVFAAATVLTLEAALSFLGLGAAHYPSWGAALGELARAGRFDGALPPLLGVLLTLGALYCLAEWLETRLATRPSEL